MSAPLTTWFRRRRGVVAVAAAGVALSGVSWLAAAVESERIAGTDRDRLAERAAASVQRNVDRAAVGIRVLAAQFGHDHPAPVGRSDAAGGIFGPTFADGAALVATTPGVRAVEWAPRVSLTDRAAFEGVHGYSFTERPTAAARRSAGQRNAYYPVAFVVPATGNGGVIGFDLDGPGAGRPALEAAVARQAPTATAIGPLAEGAPGALLLAPVVDDVVGGLVSRGLVVAVLATEDLLTAARAELPAGTRVAIDDRAGGPPTAGAGEATAEVLGRSWRIVVRPPDGYGGLGALPLALAALVLVGSAVAATFAWMVSRRRRLVERLVVERTAEAVAAQRDAEDAHRVLEEIASAVEEFLFTAVLEPDGPGRLSFSGPGMERILGTVYAPDEAIERWNALVHPQDLEKVRQTWRYANLARLERVDQTYRLLGVDGRERWLREKLVPRIDASGRLVVHGVVSDVTAIRAAQAEAERQSRTDALTGLANRRSLVELYDLELARVDRAGTRVGLLMLDIDHFKSYNDRFGHAVGDAILTGVARRLEGAARPYDVVARWGGEEFAILTPDLPGADDLRALGERLRLGIADEAIAGHAVTVSIGAVLGAEALRTLEALVNAADRALYAAKRHGRNLTCLYSDLTVDDFVAEEPEAIRLAQALATAAAVREGMPALHCQQVADLSQLIAEELHLGEGLVMRCRIGGWLHDVGKSVIPDHILGKRGDLSEEEWAVMRNHTVIGDEIVRRIAGLGDAARAIRHHHERYDGGGYPDGLAREEIPIEARIVCCADAYSAITSDRVYARGRARSEAVLELRRSAATHLDPAVVEALVRVLERDEDRIEGALRLIASPAQA
jgi:diguanylate cyclase (GGDEF)-like protein/PAS domain S-box-containing protein